MRDALVSPLLDAALRGAVVLVAALVLTTLLRRRPAAVRHAIWAGAVAAQLLLLALAVWGPRWRVAAPDAVSALVPPSPGGDVATAPAVRPAPSVADVSPSAAPSAPRADSSPTPGSGPVVRPSATASDAVAPTVARPRVSLAAVLLALWALGAAAVLLRLAAGTVIVARLARRGTRVDDGGWLSLAQRLATTLRIERPLTLLRGDRLGVPVTWGVVYPVVLLPEDADAWPEERRRYVLVHEMAHVKRLDALTQLLGQVALALFWFDPLVWIAVRRMQLEREHACDDYVLRHGTQPSRYAADLLEMVQSLGTPAHRAAQPAFAALAMARRSEFEGRMLSILDPVLDRHPLHRGRTLMSALASLLIIVPLAALQPYRQAPVVVRSTSASSEAASSATATRSTDGSASSTRTDARRSERLQSLDSAHALAATRRDDDDSSPGRSSTSSSSSTDNSSTTTNASSTSTSSSTSSTSSSTTRDDDSCDRFRPGNSSNTQFHMHADDDGASQTVRYLDFNDRRCLQADIRGKLLLDEKEDHIIAMTPAGSARAYFRERTDGVDREYTFVSQGPAGTVGTGPVLYRVNGVTMPYDDAGRRWFADLLPRVLAEASINVEPRVKRWRSQGGTDNALRHIAELRSSGAKRSHYGALLDDKLPAPELERLVRQAGRDIPSSGDLRAVLSKASEQAGRTQVSASVLDSAISAIASNGDRTAVLLAFGQSDDRGQLLAVMRVAESVSSNGDKARLLIELAPRYLEPNDAALRKRFFATAVTITSSGDLARVLLTAVPHAPKSNDATIAIIEAASEIASSGDRARVLVALAATGAVRSQPARDAYLRVTREIPSSSDARSALEALAAH